MIRPFNANISSHIVGNEVIVKYLAGFRIFEWVVLLSFLQFLASCRVIRSKKLVKEDTDFERPEYVCMRFKYQSLVLVLQNKAIFSTLMIDKITVL